MIVLPTVKSETVPAIRTFCHGRHAMTVNLMYRLTVPIRLFTYSLQIESPNLA